MTEAGAVRARWTEHRGVRILQVDLSGIREPAVLRGEAEAVRDVIRLAGPDSLLVLTDLSGVPYTLENVQILRDFSTRNRRYVRARAVVGLPPVAVFAAGPFARLTGRPLRAFGSVEEAKDWLAEQAGA